MAAIVYHCIFMLALKFPTPGFQNSSANTTVEAAVRVKPGNR